MHWTVGVALATLYEGRLNKSSIGASDDATTLPLAAWQSRAEERALKGDEGREKRWEQGARGKGGEDVRTVVAIVAGAVASSSVSAASAACFALLVPLFIVCALLFLFALRSCCCCCFSFYLYAAKALNASAAAAAVGRAKGRRGELGGAPRQRTEEDTQQFQQQ